MGFVWDGSVSLVFLASVVIVGLGSASLFSLMSLNLLCSLPLRQLLWAWLSLLMVG